MAPLNSDEDRLNDKLDPARFEREIANGNTSPGYQQASGKMGTSGKQPLTNGELSGAEHNTGANSGSPSEALSKNFGGGFWNENAASGGKREKFKKAAAALSGNRKLLLGGGAGGAVVLLIVLALAGILPYEIVHLEKNLIGYEARVERRVEQKASQKLLQEIVCRKLAAGGFASKVSACNKNSDPEDDKTASEQAAEDKAGAGGTEPTLTDEMDSFDITSPEIVQKLAGSGIKVVTDPATGEFKGLVDETTGQDITGDIGTNDVLFQRIETALPEWDVGQLEAFRPLLVDHAGASLRGLPPDTPNENVDKEIVDEVDKGATPQDIIDSTAEVQQEPNPGQENSPPNPGELGSVQAATGPLADAENAANSTLQSTGNAAAATDAATGAFMKDVGATATNPLMLSSVATTLCTVENAAVKASAARIPEIMTLLVRNSALLISTASQLQDGKVPSKGLNGLMQILNSDQPKTASNSSASGSSGNYNLPWTSSAAWADISGNPVNNNPLSKDYTPGMEKSDLPTLNSGSKMVNRIKSLMHLTGGNLSCSLLTGPLGIFAQTAIGGVQLVTDLGSFGTAQLLFGAGIIAFQQTMQRVVIPEIVSYFTPVGLVGTGSGAQLFNNAAAGSNIAFNDYARSLGGNPQTTNQANASTAAANNAQVALNNSRSWTYRTFALSDPASLVSHLANDLPLGTQSLADNLFGFLGDFPDAIFKDIGSVFSASFVHAQAAPTNAGALYGLTQYSYSNQTLNNLYDPIANEQYLDTQVHATACHPTIKGCDFYQTYGVRITMLGNPNDKNLMVGYNDPNPNDLLHCYINSFTQFPDPPVNDPICRSVGNYDLSVTDPNGQPMAVPNRYSIAAVYCRYLGQHLPLGDFLTNCPTDGSGLGDLAGQINHDAARFRQYLLDSQVMSNYVSLTNNQ